MEVEHYDLLAEPLLEKYSDTDSENAYDLVAEELVKRVHSGEIWFPFQRYFRGVPQELFENLKKIDLPVVTKRYRLHSYYPEYGTYLPPEFRGVPTVLSSVPESYSSADVISDHFIEHVRLKAKRYDQMYSVLECWRIDYRLKEFMKVALKKGRVTPKTLRDSIYESHPETKIFNPTWARALLKVVVGDNLAGKKWLDISAGWGDRLIAAMSLDMDYTGFDPNVELEQGHSNMIKMLGDPKRHRVIYEPFEKATVPGGPYDVVLSSPPYFTIEDYAPGQEGQSIVNYPNFNQWMVWFLFEALQKAWSNLKDGGYLILHLGDAKTIRTCEAANIFIENYLPGASWEGVIGIQGLSGYPRPVWVWEKQPRGVERTVWEPRNTRNNRTKGQLPYSRRTLFGTYPELQKELLGFYAAKYSPNYTVHKNNASDIRDHVDAMLPLVPRDTIDKSLHDDLLITSLLETHSVEDTIQLAVSLAQSSLDSTLEYATKHASVYFTHKDDAASIRASVSRSVPRSSIDILFSDDLMLYSLLETMGVDGTIKWAMAMVKLSFRQ